MSYRILLALLVAFMATGCLERPKTAQSSSSPVVVPPASGGAQRFAAVHSIFQNTCVSCHAQWASYSEADFLAAPGGLVVAGNSAGSLLFQRLKGSGFGNATMPMAGQWTSDELTKFRDWIDKIGSDPQPSPSPSPSPSPGGGLNASQRRSAALNALQINGCLGCHTSTKAAISADYSGATVPAFGGYTADMSFVTNGLILPGNASSSWLYRVLRGYGNIGTMPVGGGTPTPAEAKAVQDWIDNLANP